LVDDELNYNVIRAINNIDTELYLQLLQGLKLENEFIQTLYTIPRQMERWDPQFCLRIAYDPALYISNSLDIKHRKELLAVLARLVISNATSITGSICWLRQTPKSPSLFIIVLKDILNQIDDGSVVLTQLTLTEIGEWGNNDILIDIPEYIACCVLPYLQSSSTSLGKKTTLYLALYTLNSLLLPSVSTFPRFDLCWLMKSEPFSLLHSLALLFDQREAILISMKTVDILYALLKEFMRLLTEYVISIQDDYNKDGKLLLSNAPNIEKSIKQKREDTTLFSEENDDYTNSGSINDIHITQNIINVLKDEKESINIIKTGKKQRKKKHDDIPNTENIIESMPEESTLVGIENDKFSVWRERLFLSGIDKIKKQSWRNAVKQVLKPYI
ncbi:8909_t:CDS:2, partial [Racocetra fulgida]